MMLRSVMVERRREHNDRADRAEAALMSTPFWRWRQRGILAEEAAWNRDRAQWYAEALGEEGRVPKVAAPAESVNAGPVKETVSQ